MKKFVWYFGLIEMLFEQWFQMCFLVDFCGSHLNMNIQTKTVFHLLVAYYAPTGLTFYLMLFIIFGGVLFLSLSEFCFEEQKNNSFNEQVGWHIYLIKVNEKDH